MGFLRKAFEPITGPGIFWPQDVAAGTMPEHVRVTEQSAYSFMPYLAAVRAISEDLAKLPFIVYEQEEVTVPGRPAGKRRAPEHPIYTLLHDSPNQAMTAFVFRETLQAHAMTWGNGYAEKQMKRSKDPFDPYALWPLRPDRVRVFWNDAIDQKVYEVTLPDGSKKELSADRVFHLPGLGFDGLVGYSVVHMMRKALALGLSAQAYGTSTWENGGRPGGVLEVPKEVDLDDTGKANLRRQWDAAHTGLSNAQRFAILEDGITWKDVQIPPEDAQYIETRKFQTEEIARGFRIPQHKIGNLDKATFSNIEQQALEYVTDSLGGWAVRWEQQAKKDLIGPGPFFCEHLFDALLRTDTLTRWQAWAIAHANGNVTPNYINSRENLPLRTDPGGDQYQRPLNMAVEPGGTNPDGSSRAPTVRIDSEPVPVSSNGTGPEVAVP